MKIELVRRRKVCWEKDREGSFTFCWQTRVRCVSFFVNMFFKYSCVSFSSVRWYVSVFVCLNSCGTECSRGCVTRSGYAEYASTDLHLILREMCPTTKAFFCELEITWKFTRHAEWCWCLLLAMVSFVRLKPSFLTWIFEYLRHKTVKSVCKKHSKLERSNCVPPFFHPVHYFSRVPKQLVLPHACNWQFSFLLICRHAVLLQNLITFRTNIRCMLLFLEIEDAKKEEVFLRFTTSAKKLWMAMSKEWVNAVTLNHAINHMFLYQSFIVIVYRNSNISNFFFKAIVSSLSGTI